MAALPGLAHQRWVFLAMIGLMAGAVHMAIQMVYEGSAGSGPWTPLKAIAAVLMRDLLDEPAAGGAASVLVGTVLHFGFSLACTYLFAVWAPALSRRLMPLIGLGLLWGVFVYALARLVIMPLADPAMLTLDQGALFLSHVLWGLTVGSGLFWLVGIDRPGALRQVRPA